MPHKETTKTKEHIRKIAERHNFVPNASGKTLKQKLAVLPKMMRKKLVDAVVLVGIKHEEFVRQLQLANVPVILVDPKTDIPNC